MTGNDSVWESPEAAADLTDRLKAEARRLGFDQAGIAPAVSPPGYPRFRDWLEAGYAAGMGYMERNAGARADPDRVLEGVRSVVVVSFVYGRPEPVAPTVTQGKVARYARGADYHQVLWRRLEALLAWLRAECPEARGRAVADTAPLLERDFAQLAGLGWIGKNTMLIDRRAGSFTVLGALLVDVALRPDTPHNTNHCGTCTRCLDACPTDAFAGPYQLDSRRCISYWTIEHKGPIADTMAGELGDWVFGCDVCQDVCPWNRKPPPGRTKELDPRPEWTNPDLDRLAVERAGRVSPVAEGNGTGACPAYRFASQCRAGFGATRERGGSGRAGPDRPARRSRPGDSRSGRLGPRPDRDRRGDCRPRRPSRRPRSLVSQRRRRGTCRGPYR